MDAVIGSSLHCLLPDVQCAIGDNFTSTACSVQVSPDLTASPYHCPFQALGKKVHLLQSSSSTAVPKDFHVIKQITGDVVVTDGAAGDCLHLALDGGTDWITPLQKVFNQKFDKIDWCFVVLELRLDFVHFHVLREHTDAIIMCPDEATKLWLRPVVIGAPPVVKPKVTKKVVKKTTSAAATAGNGTVTKSTKSGVGGTKLVRKKTTTAAANNDLGGGSEPVILHAVENGVVKRTSPVAGKTSSKDSASKGSECNGDLSGDSGISTIDSDTEKSPKKLSTESSSDSRCTDLSSPVEFLTPSSTPDSGANVAIDDDCDDHLSATFTLSLNTIKQLKEANGGGGGGGGGNAKMECIFEEEEKQKADSKNNLTALNNYRNNTNLPNLAKKPIVALHTDPVCRSITPSQNHSDQSAFRSCILKSELFLSERSGNLEMPPVLVLQLVLKKLTYKQIGLLRQVHPHWDEICGQLLNTGYLELVRRAELLLAECQRRLAREPSLHDLLASLTSVQVHILNPVDILRPAIDEGVCCFPYGELLDKTTVLIDEAQQIMKSHHDMTVNINWKPVAELARRAQVHYRFNLENVMEEKLGDVVHLKALQSIHRIDSFIIDSTVNKLEKAAHLARDEMEWEIDQLRHQNVQLKKDNREMRKDCMRLESRVEALESKFKTMARLLQ